SAGLDAPDRDAEAEQPEQQESEVRPPGLLGAVERPGAADQHASGEQHEECEDHAVLSRGERGRVRSQLDSSAAPASPDFSGWNWVAHRAPFSTVAMNSA